jgi:phenylalanyl-tRNA synthetase alpha chain
MTMDDLDLDSLQRLATEAELAMSGAGSLADLERARVAYLGKQGKITLALRALGRLPSPDRPAAGKAVNEARQRAEAALDCRQAELQAQAAAQQTAAEQLDVTLPGRRAQTGHRHPLMIVYDEICDIFIGMGYQVMTGPEVEWAALNWTALNYPPDHPAMDEQDSFYITDQVMLRTHTSPVQIRAMRLRHADGCPVRGLDWRSPPLEVLSHCRCRPAPTKVIIPGRCYRRENVTLTHSDVFYQLECLLVDEDVSFADLKGTMATFVREYFGADIGIRFRPDFFPFTEPSADFSINCELCRGRGCRFCKESGWVEIGGSGLVHPNVLVAGGYHPNRVSGFAFGFGIERIAQRRFGIEDIRILYEDDMRFLRQF